MKPPVNKFSVIVCIAVGLAGFIFCIFHDDHSVSPTIRVGSGIANLVAWWLFAAFLTFVVPRIRK
jgi:hypothetical protein